MSERDLVRHSAPTLAGLKTASLFTCPYESQEQVMDSVRALNRRLGAKGLRVLPLRFSESRVLIYVYRPRQLSQDLSHATARRLLAHRGYDCESCEKCVVKLVQKLRRDGEFPHEIGLFLGYPPEDVHGFMELGPDGCKCTGYWKVYGNEDAARKKFRQFRKCTQVYCDLADKGRDIERLTVAG